MLKHYLTIAGRNLFRSKAFSFINILGLAVGMGVCLLIYQYIYFELSYDQFYSNAQNMYRLTTTEVKSGENLGTSVWTIQALGGSAKQDIPEIKDFVRIHPQEALVISDAEKNEPYMEDGIWYVDSNFLDMFDFPLKYGNKKTILNTKYSIVITEQMAVKYFGYTNPVGKVLKVSGGIYSGSFEVTGVLKSLPVNSHLQFDFLMPMSFLLESNRLYSESGGWEYLNFITYVSLDKSADLQKVREKLDQLISTYAGDIIASYNVKWNIGLQSVTDIHLKSDYPRDPVSNNGNIQDVQYFSIIAIFILLMAWVNYINLSTAQAIRRAKEVGVRKTIGAARAQLINQFIIESVLINLIAGILSIGLAIAMLPILNSIIGKELQFNILQDLKFWGWFTGCIIVGSLISGLYPAFVLSSFKPISVFGKIKLNQNNRFSLRESLIVFQFLTSVLLISGTYLVYKQILFMKSKDLGIDMEKILVVNGPMVFIEDLIKNGETIGPTYKAFKNELASYSAVSAVSGTSSVPGKGYFYTERFRNAGKGPEKGKEGNVLLVDTDFADVYELDFLAKAPYRREISPDEMVIINEEAVKIFGLESAKEALHKFLVNQYGDSLEVVGVVKNVHWSSLKNAHSPHLYILNNEYGAYFSVRMNLVDIRGSLENIKSAYHAVFPNDPFDYFFLEDDFNKQYQAELQFGNLFSAFSVLAIFIACLGLFALVSYSANARIKEIGIRKVLGAGVGNIMMLLSREFLVLLIIANLLAIPAIAVGGKFWLDNFAFRIGIGLDILLLPALILFIVSLLTVSYRTYTTARANPVKSLRKE